MEKVESPLEVLSRAALLIQDRKDHKLNDSDSSDLNATASSNDSEDCENQIDSPSSTDGSFERAAVNIAKDLPSARWRRERRSTRQPDYRPKEQSSRALRSHSFNDRITSSSSVSAAAHSTNGLNHKDRESPESNGSRASSECTTPIDMRLYRPSVITPPQLPTNSVSMCDPVIDEHFRRSLGPNYYEALFGKKNDSSKSNTKDRGSSPIVFQQDPCKEFLAMKEDGPKGVIKPEVAEVQAEAEVENSVDDHFAKALGATWKKIQSNMDKSEEKTKIITRSGVVI